MKTVILAGGLGTRISEETVVRPKPMVEIGGQPILWHIMKYYLSFGYNDFIICCGYKGHMIKEYFADYYLHRSDVTFDFTGGDNRMIVHANVSEPWKVTLVDTGQSSMTGGRIKRIKKYVGNERFFITYGDGVSNIDLHQLLQCHEESHTVLTVSAVQPGGRFGVLDFDEDGKLSGIREKAKEDGGWINAGFMVAEPELFDYLDGDDCVLETKPFERLTAEGKMAAFKHNGFWQCMDTKRDMVLLERLWEEDRRPWKTWE